MAATRLGRYEILRELGRGAMGVVYLARDPLIGRLVALKTFRLAYATDEGEREQLRSRFLREAQSAGILSQHPGIVTIHDVAEEGSDGAAFIAMEYVEGIDLKELMRREGPLDPAAAAELIGQIAAALDYAHSKGVVHRDVKPANVILTAERQIRITDFGIARVNTSNLTQDGQMLGTPNYMAPEQVQGLEVDHRADIFSLGVILYELLTRRKPFQGENLTVVTHRIVYDDFTPLEQHLQGLPAGVSEVLGRALAKSPAERYQRAGEMAADLARAVGAAAPAAASSVPAGTAPPPAAATGGEGRAPARQRAAAETGGWRQRLAAAGAALGGALGPVGARLAGEWRRVPRWRLVAVAAGSLLLMLIAGIVLFQLPRSIAPAAESPAAFADLALRAQYLDLIKEGRRRLAAEDPAGAAQAFRRAERLALNPAAARALREQAERQVEEAAASGEVERSLTAARAARDERRWDEALTAANRVLGLDPEHEEAREIALAAEAALESRGDGTSAAGATGRTRTVPRTTRRIGSPQTGRPPPPAAGAAATPPPAPGTGGDSTLTVELTSAVAEGSVVVAIDDRRVVSRRWEFYDKGGVFSRRRPTSGELELPPVRIDAGTKTLQIWVSVGDKPARLNELTGLFPAGGGRRLILRVDRDEAVSVRLE